MKDLSFPTDKVTAPEVGADDTEFESLLRRAADCLTSRPSLAAHQRSGGHESLGTGGHNSETD
jgi:hypothetical protein